MVAIELRLDQSAARGRRLGDDRRLQAGIIEQASSQAERVFAPNFDFRQALTHAIALDWVVVDEEETIQRETKLIGDGPDVVNLVIPIDAPCYEISRGQQAMTRVIVGIFPQVAHGRFIIFADAGEHDATLLET